MDRQGASVVRVVCREYNGGDEPGDERVRHLGWLMVGLLLLGAAIPAQARSYYLNRIDVAVQVRPDGSMHVTEQRQVTYRGTYHHFDRVIPLPYGTRLENVSVADEQGPYLELTAGGPGTYQVSWSGNEADIAWHYDATDVAKTFVLQYDVLGAVELHADAAELYWQFIEPNHAWEASESRVAVSLPGAVAKSQISVWAHGPLHGDAQRQDGGVVLTCSPLPANTLVEARLLFPREVVFSSPRSDGQAIRAQVLAQEGEWAEQANALRARARWRLALPVLVALGGFLIWLGLYLGIGREHHLGNSPEYVREPVEGWTPVQVGYLWRWGNLSSQDMTASLMDLVRRGALRLSVEKEEHARWGGLLGTALEDEQYVERVADFAEPLSASEKHLIDRVLFDGMEALHRISMEEFRETAKSDPNVAHARYQLWTALAKEECDSIDLIDGKSSVARSVVVAAGVMALLATMVLAIGGATPLSFLPGFVGVAMLVGNKAILRRNAGAAAALEQWQGFRRYLLHFSHLKEYPAPAVALWEHYLVYAISLGVADRVIQQFQALYPRVPAEQRSALNFFPHWTASGGTPLSSMRSLGSAFSSFSSSFSAAASSFTSASGEGGGFSGGGFLGGVFGRGLGGGFGGGGGGSWAS